MLFLNQHKLVDILIQDTIIALVMHHVVVLFISVGALFLTIVTDVPFTVITVFLWCIDALPTDLFITIRADRSIDHLIVIATIAVIVMGITTNITGIILFLFMDLTETLLSEDKIDC